MTTTVEVRDLTSNDIAACADILYGLPDWFGLEAANEAYVQSLHELPGVVALTDGAICGFLALAEHTPQSYEIHVMGVPETMHRQGVGAALVAWADRWCRDRDADWLHVKTRGPATPDPGYERTRKFYVACGFEPLFETLELWGPEDAALILVKHLKCRNGGPGDV